MTLTFFFSMFCSLSSISLSWKTLVFGRFTSQERTNVHRMAFFLHTPDFSLSKVPALKLVWGKDTSRRSKEPGSDLPSCFSAWAPFCKCGWRHHISKSGCGPDCRTRGGTPIWNRRGSSSSPLGVFWILVSLRVFRAKRQYFKPPRSRLGFRKELEIYDNAFKHYY